MPSFREYMDAVFGEIATIAGRPELIPNLFTKDLAEDIRQEQYNKLRKLRPFGGGPELMVGGGFVYRQRMESDILLYVSVGRLSDTEIDDLDLVMADHGGQVLEFDPASFCSLALQAQGAFQLRREYRQGSAALNEVVIFRNLEEYAGHEIGDVIGWYEPVRCYRLEITSLIAQSKIVYVLALLSCSHSAFRSSVINSSMAEKLLRLLQLSNVNPENIYFASTTSHWKHIFIEVYRLLEALYYLPWILSFRVHAGHGMPALALAQHCREGLAWREREGASIKKLFEMLPAVDILEPNFVNSDLFKGIRSEDVTPSLVAERVYKVRNQLVHQEDYEDREILTLGPSFWPVAVSFLLDILISVYAGHATDTAYEFLLDEKELALVRP